MRSCTISEKLYPCRQVSCQWVCIFNLLMKVPWEKREHKWWRHKLMSFLYCSAYNAIARTYCMHKFAGIYYSHFVHKGRSPTRIWVFKTSCLLVCNNSLDSWPLIANNWMLSQEKAFSIWKFHDLQLNYNNGSVFTPSICLNEWKWNLTYGSWI